MKVDHVNLDASSRLGDSDRLGKIRIVAGHHCRIAVLAEGDEAEVCREIDDGSLFLRSRTSTVRGPVAGGFAKGLSGPATSGRSSPVEPTKDNRHARPVRRGESHLESEAPGGVSALDYEFAEFVDDRWSGFGGISRPGGDGTTPSKRSAL